MTDSEKINELRMDVDNLKNHILVLESVLQQLQVWQQNFRFDIGDEHLIQMAKRIEVLHSEGKI